MEVWLLEKLDSSAELVNEEEGLEGEEPAQAEIGKR